MKLKLPLTAQLEITESCNLRCTHCYRLDSEDVPKFTNNDNIHLIIQKLIDSKIFNVVLTGGEPLMDKDNLKSIIVKLKSHKINVSLNTNLLLLTDDFINFLKDININSLLISCPSSNNDLYHQITGGNYSVFERKLKKIIESNINFSINMVVTNINKNSIIDTARSMSELGVKIFGATPMGLNPLYPRFDLLLNKDDVISLIDNLIWIKDNLNMKIDIMEAIPKCIMPKEVIEKNYYFAGRKCQAGISIISISPNGDVRPCSHNSDVYGNLLTEELSDIWDRMYQWRNGEFVPEKCTTCKLIEKCGGGCRVTSKVAIGCWNSEDIWMDKPFTEFIQIKNDLVLDPTSRFKLTESILTRNEGENFLICTKSSKNAIMVNKEFLDLISFFKSNPGVSVTETATAHDIDLKDNKFQSIIKLLITKKFLIYV